MIDTGTLSTQPISRGALPSPTQVTTETQKKMSTNFQIYFQLLQERCHELFPARSSKVIRRLASSSWKELEQDQKNMFVTENMRSPSCLKLVQTVVDDGDISSSSDCSENGDDQAPILQTKDDNEPTDELYWSESLQLVVISLRNAIPDTVSNLTCANDLNLCDDFDIIIIPVDAAASEYQQLTVKQSSLSLFDSSRLSKIADAETADFSMALRLFADWDDFDRNSYDWISTGSADYGALSLIRNPMKWKAWRNSVWAGCPVSVRSFLGGRAKVYLYFLIAQRSFDTEDAWEVLRQIDGVLTSNGVVKEGSVSIKLSMTQGQLMDLISKVRSQDLDVADNTFRRHSSRIGGAYQAAIEPFNESKPLRNRSGYGVKEKEDTERAKTSLVYTPEHGLDENAMNSYLSQGLTKVPVRTGLLVTASKHAVGSSSITGSNQLGGGVLSLSGAGTELSRLARRRVCMVERCTEEATIRKPLPLPQTEAPTSLAVTSQASSVAMGANTSVSTFGSSSLVSPDTQSDVDQNTTIPLTRPPSEPTPPPSEAFPAIQTTVMNDYSSSSNEAHTATMPIRTVFVHDSLETYSIPVSFCLPRPSWQECLLEVLHKYEYNADKALEAWERELEFTSMEVKMSKVWDIQLINMLFRVARTTDMDVRELYTTLRKSLPSQVGSDGSALPSLTMKDIIFVYGQIFVSNLCGLSDGLLGGDALVSRPRRRNRGVVHPPGSRISYTLLKDGIPNRWPSSIRYARHNLLWMRLNNIPCVCLTLDLDSTSSNGTDPGVRIFPICSITPRKAQTVAPGSLVQFDVASTTMANTDKRTVDFALAMKDFAEKELQQYPDCKWYVYPAFIMELLASHNDWRAWRSQVERSSRGKVGAQDFRKVYLEALLEQYERVKEEDERCLDGGYPWDDSIVVPPPPPPPPAKVAPPPRMRLGDVESLSGLHTSKKRSSAVISGGSALEKDSAGKRSLLKSVDSLITATTARKEKPPPAPPPSPSPPPAPSVVSMSNLFWSDKMGLPCIFYDYPEQEWEERFRVLPISTLGHKYDTSVSKREIKALTLANLKNCTDEKTRDLGEALLMFYEWHERTDIEALLTEGEADSKIDESEANLDSISKEVKSDTEKLQPFQWPDFVLDILVYQDKWKAWATGVERKLVRNGKQNVRVPAYFARLKEQFIESLRLQREMEELEGIEDSGSADEKAEGYSETKNDNQSATTFNSVLGGGSTVKDKRGRKKGWRKSTASKDTTKGPSIGPEGARPPTQPQSKSKPPREIIKSNLFWLPQFELPAVFYDDEGNEQNESFFVFPFCAASAKYYMEMKASSLKPLTFANIVDCTNTPTRCFGEALLRFYDWAQTVVTSDPEENEDPTNSDEDGKSLSSPVQRPSSAPSSEKPYVWPDFILDLIAHKPQWNSWRREVERTGRGRNPVSQEHSGFAPLTDLYFAGLQRDYCALNDLPYPPPRQPTPTPMAKKSELSLASSQAVIVQDNKSVERTETKEHPANEDMSDKDFGGIESESCSDTEKYYPEDDVHAFYNPVSSLITVTPTATEGLGSERLDARQEDVVDVKDEGDEDSGRGEDEGDDADEEDTNSEVEEKSRDESSANDSSSEISEASNGSCLYSQKKRHIVDLIDDSNEREGDRLQTEGNEEMDSKRARTEHCLVSGNSS